MWKMNGRMNQVSKFAIYAGHGGPDSGAVTGSRKEKDYTLKVMTAVSGLLKSAGHTVINNRTTDVARDIKTDATKADNNNVTAVIEIHLNSNEGTPGTGCETYYYSTSTKGKTLAKAINDRIAVLGFKDRGIKTGDNLGIVRRPKAPSVLVETAFINNEDDMKRYDVANMAYAITNGILAVYGGSASNNQNGSSNSNSSSSGLPYTVIITTSDGSNLNIRSGPGTQYSIRGSIANSTKTKQVKYTIIEEKNGWGKLKSGAGWIKLSHTTKK